MKIERTDESVRQIILKYLYNNRNDFSHLFKREYNWISNLNLTCYFKQYKCIEEGLVKVLPELKDTSIQNRMINNINLDNVKGIFNLLVYVNNINIREMNLSSLQCLKVQKISNKLFNRSRLKTLEYCIGEDKFDDSYIVYQEIYYLINIYIIKLIESVKDYITYIRDIKAYQLKNFKWYRYLNNELGGFKGIKSYIVENHNLFNVDEYGKINKDIISTNNSDTKKTLIINVDNISKFSNSELIELANSILKSIENNKL